MAEIAERMQSRHKLLRTILYMDDWRDHQHDDTDLSASHLKPSDPAMILYTSGTTGKPKGVVVSHRAIVNNASLGSLRFEIQDGLPWLNSLPYFHIGGSVMATLGCIARLGTHVVLPGFEPSLALKLLEEEEIAWFPFVPTMLIKMIEHPDFAKTNLSKLQLLLTGGAVITPEFVRMTRERLSAEVQVMFGQTEAGGGMTKTFRGDSVEKITGSVGMPEPWTSLKIVRTSDDQVAAIGEIGEICVSSPFVMLYYLDNETATESAFHSDGYLRTGDLGSIDSEGYVHVTGRLKEMIIRGGENIYPREIEDILADYPGVAEVAVIGVPHVAWGEELAAVVQPLTGATCDSVAMGDFLRERIARHKVPKLWRIVDDFPRTASGKVQKFELVRWFVDNAKLQ